MFAKTASLSFFISYKICSDITGTKLSELLEMIANRQFMKEV